MVFVVIVAIMINTRRHAQILTVNIIAAIIALLMVVKMLYQIQYIDHNNWNVNCTVSVLSNLYKESMLYTTIF